MSQGSRIAWVTSLAVALTLPAAPPAVAQDGDQDRIRWLEIGLVGVTADMEHGKRLGQDCRWYADSTDDVAGCWISVGTLNRAGVPVVEGEEIDLRQGVFGRERYRLAGRITSIGFRKIRGPVRSFGRVGTVQRIQDPLVDEQGRVVARPRAQSNDLWRGVRRDRERLQVRASVAWVLYDSRTSSVVAEGEERGSADTYADAVYGSMERFLDDIVEEDE
ncbi:MAG: hypothetical protein ACE5FP_02690 [Gemmatimonadota bacterium]